MNLKVSKNGKYRWTRHSLYKMRQYGLSAQRISRVIRSPERIEAGIVKNTIVVMQPTSKKIKNGKNFWNQEIWAMYQYCKNAITCDKAFSFLKTSKTSVRGSFFQNRKKFLKNEIKIISAWRYPGISPKKNPIPEDILKEIISKIKE